MESSVIVSAIRLCCQKWTAFKNCGTINANHLLTGHVVGCFILVNGDSALLVFIFCVYLLRFHFRNGRGERGQLQRRKVEIQKNNVLFSLLFLPPFSFPIVFPLPPLITMSDCVTVAEIPGCQCLLSPLMDWSINYP